MRSLVQKFKTMTSDDYMLAGLLVTLAFCVAVVGYSFMNAFVYLQ